jgi:hypothetical protein
MDLRDIGWDGMDWIDLAEDSDQWRVLLNTVMNPHKDAGQFLSSFSRRAQLHERR